jgi:hypothetical protein
MKQNLPITRAFCVELGRVVTITEARREFLSRIPPLGAFTFQCDDQACISTTLTPVLITGVNYRFAAEEKVKYKAAHFRHEHGHRVGCRWVLDSENIGTMQPVPAHDGAKIFKTARSKSNDLVTAFDPTIRSKPRTLAVATAMDEAGDGPRQRPDSAIMGIGLKINSKDGETRTHDLERLVESFVEARSSLDPESFRKLSLKIKGSKQTTYREYFQQIQYCDSDTLTGITYGGVVFIQDYATGFKLSFFDSIRNYPVSLYVSKQQLRAYHYGQYLRAIVNTMRDTGRYATVYFIGKLSFNERRNQFDVAVQHLSHLCIMLAPKSRP